MKVLRTIESFLPYICGPVNQAFQISNRLEQKRISFSLNEMSALIKEGSIKTLPIIIKGDVDGSIDALSEQLEKIARERIEKLMDLARDGSHKKNYEQSERFDYILKKWKELSGGKNIGFDNYQIFTASDGYKQSLLNEWYKIIIYNDIHGSI